MQKTAKILIMFFLMGMLLACGSNTADETVSEVATAEETKSEAVTSEAVASETTASETIPENTEAGTEATSETESTAEATAATPYQATLEEVVSLIHKADEDTADLLGGGEENWTQDKSFFIGRIYQIEMDGAEYPVYTSCDENNIINSVSMWIADGNRTVSEEEVNQWVRKLEEFAGFEAVYDGTTSEVGSRNWQWDQDGCRLSLMWSGDILTISVNPMVGELH